MDSSSSTRSDRLKPLEQVKKITSKAEDGLAVLQLEFIPDADADRKRRRCFAK